MTWLTVRRLKLLMLALGLVMGTQVPRLFPPPPVFSEHLGRINHLQSCERAYFASLRAFTHTLDGIVAAGRVPVVAIGDSTFRGTGADGANVWTARLQRELQTLDPAYQVVNFSQNGGDLIAPFLFFHFHKLFPTALFVMQWNYSNGGIGIRHPSHLWLSSEIMLRDGDANPAVRLALRKVPIETDQEWLSLVMAGLNIAVPYLDFGNAIRYWALGTPSVSARRNPVITPLSRAESHDLEEDHFTPRTDPQYNDKMHEIYAGILKVLGRVSAWTPEQTRTFFDTQLPAEYRDRLLLVTVDLNPYYAPVEDPAAMADRPRRWQALRQRLAEVPGLNWTSLIHEPGGLSVDDFVDLGHLSVPGQVLLARTVAAGLAAMPAVRARLETRGPPS